MAAPGSSRKYVIAGVVAATIAFSFVGTAASVPAPSNEGNHFFETKIRPLLIERCYECHSATSKKIKGGLTVDSREQLLKGGESGPAIVPGNPEKSLLIQAVRYTNKDLQMPPKHQLAADEVALLEQWIKIGVAYPQTTGTLGFAGRLTNHWAFRPIVKNALPTVKNGRWPATSADYFILAKLEHHGMTPNFASDKGTLLRRASFDLGGLPPSPEAIADFVNDRSPDAFEKIIDRLLASPRYGERWGRYWLDLARYADTAGDSADYPIPQAYKYRNYVINAFNADKPYDEFIREQIAGDLLPSRSDNEKREKLIATGYLALARRFGVDPQSVQHLTLEDTIDTMGRSILGLSLSCARCHDHKYDPIPTEDYYGLYGIFNSTRFPFPGSENKKRPADLIPLVPQAEVDAVLKPFRKQLSALDDQIEKLESEGETLRNEGLDSRDVRKALRELKKKREELITKAPEIDYAFAVAEGKPGNARVQRRGEPGMVGAEVPRHFLQVLGGQTLPANETGSGRLQLAHWLTSPTNPLTARVIVNRIWQHHFGKGLVQTPSDFGVRGRQPSHPELLDHLASRFMEEGWSIKALHKLIMLSSAYQQSSAEHADYSQIDPVNEFLWRFNRQRLDAEAIRDTMLLVSGELDLRTAGQHPFPSPFTWEFTQHNQFTAIYETSQRSVYLMQQRIKKHPLLETFDPADPNSSTAERSSTTTPLQALFMMNDPFAHEQASHFVSRLGACSTSDRIKAAYRLAFGRQPSREEIREGTSYLEAFKKQSRDKSLSNEQQNALAWASFARAILASNEFLYID